MSAVQPARTLVTIGTYDGVHLGHQAILREFVADARKNGLTSLALVFPKPPRTFFQPGLNIPLLTLPRERVALMKGLGVEKVVVRPFDRRLAEIEAEEFLESFLLGELRAGGFHVGADFAFGRDRRGDAAYLEAECRRRGLHFSVHPLLLADGQKFGSSAIRERLLKGEVDGAHVMLGRPYRVTGTVVKGAGLGKKLGFPTANLKVHPDKLLPPGVFEVRALSGPRAWRAVANIGRRPTAAGGAELVVEAHLPGFKGSLYGRTLSLDFLRKLRDERKFPSLDALKEQIKKDVASIAA